MDQRFEDTSSGVAEEAAAANLPNSEQSEVPADAGASVVADGAADIASEEPAATEEELAQASKGKSRSMRIVLLILCLVVAVACGFFLVVNLPSQTSKLAYNPVNFAQLQKQNKDIVAWISIPNTQVDYPVLRSSTDDFYYMSHDEYREKALDGAIYMEMANSAEFTDPVTVLYGHNATDDSRFTTLHYFENSEFFQENEIMTVYVPGHILTYRIIATYIYDDRHILNSFDLKNEQVRASYYQSVLNPKSMVANVREGATLDVNDKILQLSTCMDAFLQNNQRLIVTGVLVDDQATA